MPDEFIESFDGTAEEALGETEPEEAEEASEETPETTHEAEQESEEEAEQALEEEAPPKAEEAAEGEEAPQTDEKKASEDKKEPQEGKKEPLPGDEGLVTLKAYGEERQYPFGEVKMLAQKGLAADMKWREADQMIKTAEGFFDRLSNVKSTGIGGMPLPFQTLLQALARQHFKGSMAQAQEYLHNELLPAYVDSQSRFSDHPELRDMQWQRYDIEQREARILREERRQAQIAKDLQVQRGIDTWGPVLQAELSAVNIDRQSPEGKKAANFLLGKIYDGDKISTDTIKQLVAQAAKDLEDLARQKLSRLTPAEIKRLNPELSAQLLKEYSEQVRRARPTVRGKAKPSTKPPRRTREPGYVDTLDELVSK